MKPSLLSIACAAVLLPGTLTTPLFGQNAVPQAPAQVPAGTQLTSYNGIVFDQGVPFLVRNGQTIRLDQIVIPAGQMLTPDGQFVPLPPQLTAPNSPAQINTGGNPAQSFNNNASTGLAIQNGQLFLVTNATAAPVNAASIPAGSMVNFQGQFVPVPALAPSSVTGQPGNPAANTAPGRAIPGFTTPGTGRPGTVPPGFTPPAPPSPPAPVSPPAGGNLAPPPPIRP